MHSPDARRGDASGDAYTDDAGEADVEDTELDRLSEDRDQPPDDAAADAAPDEELVRPPEVAKQIGKVAAEETIGEASDSSEDQPGQNKAGEHYDEDDQTDDASPAPQAGGSGGGRRGHAQRGAASGDDDSGDNEKDHPADTASSSNTDSSDDQAETEEDASDDESEDPALAAEAQELGKTPMQMSLPKG